VRVKERRDFAHEFATIPIITPPDGTQVRLEDIANISEGFEDTDRFATFNGQPAVMIRVSRVGDQTPISVSDAVLRKMAEIRHILPAGLSIQPRNDRSKVYRQRLDLMLRNGYIGLGLVFILLAIFLEARLAFWVSIGIPISFLGSLLILPTMGVSINMVSMFAFIVTLGIVVDDAIIVGENVYFQRQQGLNWFQAAVKGAHRMAMPVTFAIITNMVAFMPLFFVPGFMGKVFKHIPIVVICVFAVSLVESLFILPAHLGHQKEDGNEGGILSRLADLQRQFSRFFIRMVNTGYGPVLKWVLRWRYVTVSIGIAVLLVTIGYVKSGKMGFVLFPRVESDYAKVTAQTPFGTATEKTTAIQKRLVTAVQEIIEQNGGDQLSEGIYAFTDGNRVQVYANLTPPEERPISTAKLTKLWRRQVGKNLPGLETIKFESDAGGPGHGASIAVELSHRNIPVLERASNELAGALSQYPNVIDIDSGFSPGKQQIDFKIKPEGRSLGLESSDVARQIRHAYYGAEVLRQQRGRNEVKVIVRRPKSERISEYDLEEMTLRTPAGKDVALREVASLTRGRAYTSITRRDGRRVVTVSADARPRKKSGQVITEIKADILPALQQKYPGLTFSFEGRQADRRESMQALKKGMLMALLIIYAILAIPFNSFLQPMIIMCSIPFGIVGAIIGHLLMGYSLSVISMFGVVALSGVVVNDSLVLIEFANRRHLSGIPAAVAIHQAALHRFRPILLTTLTTFGGLSPIIFETSRQARFLIPMAISLGYGILFATLITLILVPSLYLILDDIKTMAKKL
jgi:multidrug efflux pump subunit AcrB